MRVGNVDDFFIGENFRHEGSRMEIGGDGHAEAEDEGGRVVFEKCFNGSFGGAVEGSGEICWVGFGEGGGEEGRVVGGVLGSVDAFFGGVFVSKLQLWAVVEKKKKRKKKLTSRPQHRTMHPSLLTLIRQHQRPQPITLHRLQLMTLTPIHIRPSSFPRTIDNMRRLNFVQRLSHGFLFVHACGCAVDVFALLSEKVDEETADPALGAPDEETVGGGGGGGGHGGGSGSGS